MLLGELHFDPEGRHFNSKRVIFHVIDPVYLPVLENSAFHLPYARFEGRPSGARGGDKAREIGVSRVGRDVSRVVGVDLDGAVVGFLEADEKARDENCCQAMRLRYVMSAV